VVIERGADGAPVWPAAFVGSITHTPGYCVAVAARRDEFASVGIDAEWADRLTVDLWHDVFVARELDVLAQASPAERERIAIVMFSAKETFYKCQAPLTQMWIDFTEVAIDVTFASPSRGDFVVVPMSGATRERFGHLALRGRFRFDGLLVVTGMVARAGSATW
jgi:4'-phosphopantetheinyl transferase EntD